MSLSAFRARRSSDRLHPVLYLSNDAKHLGDFEPFPFLEMFDVRSPLALRHALLTQTPDLILMEPNLDWADTLDTIRDLHDSTAAPIVLLSDVPPEKHLCLKQAFSAGLCDTLMAPFCREELAETLSVLLKLRLCAAD